MSRLETDAARQMVLEECAKAMAVLIDENESLWLMLDEIKASDIANHKERLEQASATLSSLLLGHNNRGDA